MTNNAIHSIVIYGFGDIGRDFYKHANDQVRIQICDSRYAKTANLKNLQSADAAVICLPTETKANGSRDYTKIKETVEALPQDLILIRTLLDPGTLHELQILTGKQLVYCPYIDTQSALGLQSNDPEMLIVGGNPEFREPWVYLLQKMFGHDTKYFQCQGTEAELIAATIHAFLALKITFVNEMFELSKLFAADWNIVREGWLASKPSITEGTTIRPDQRGYGGKVLPKEMLHIVTAGQRAGHQPRLLTEVHNSNLVFAVEYLGEFLKHAQEAQANNQAFEFTLLTPKLHPADGVWFKTPVAAS